MKNYLKRNLTAIAACALLGIGGCKPNSNSPASLAQRYEFDSNLPEYSNLNYNSSFRESPTNHQKCAELLIANIIESTEERTDNYMVLNRMMKEGRFADAQLKVREYLEKEEKGLLLTDIMIRDFNTLSKPMAESITRRIELQIKVIDSELGQKIKIVPL